MADYIQAITEAAGLLEPDEFDSNPEYLRGMCELLARTYGIYDMGTDVRAGMVKHDIACILGVN